MCRAARPTPGAMVQRHDTSFITGNHIDIALSYENVDEGLVIGSAPVPRLRWHVSMSQVVDDHRVAAQGGELLGGVIAGFPSADRFALHTLATNTAVHAEIPTEPREPTHN